MVYNPKGGNTNVLWLGTDGKAYWSPDPPVPNLPYTRPGMSTQYTVKNPKHGTPIAITKSWPGGKGPSGAQPPKPIKIDIINPGQQLPLDEVFDGGKAPKPPKPPTVDYYIPKPGKPPIKTIKPIIKGPVGGMVIGAGISTIADNIPGISDNVATGISTGAMIGGAIYGPTGAIGGGIIGGMIGFGADLLFPSPPQGQPSAPIPGPTIPAVPGTPGLVTGARYSFEIALASLQNGKLVYGPFLDVRSYGFFGGVTGPITNWGFVQNGSVVKEVNTSNIPVRFYRNGQEIGAWSYGFGAAQKLGKLIRIDGVSEANDISQGSNPGTPATTGPSAPTPQPKPPTQGNQPKPIYPTQPVLPTFPDYADDDLLDLQPPSQNQPDPFYDPLPTDPNQPWPDYGDDPTSNPSGPLPGPPVTPLPPLPTKPKPGPKPKPNPDPTNDNDNDNTSNPNPIPIPIPIPFPTPNPPGQNKPKPAPLPIGGTNPLPPTDRSLHRL